MPILSSLIQVGSFGTLGHTSLEAGWIICDGSAISRTIYGKLFAKISTSWGVGDGSTTFNLPDLRGFYLRGWDNGAGNDPDSGSRFPLYGGNSGDMVGTYQYDEFASHQHFIGVEAMASGAFGVFSPVPNTSRGFQYTALAGGFESRGKNAYGLIVMKYL